MRIRSCRARDLSLLEWNGEYRHDRHIIEDAFARTRRRTMLMLLAELRRNIVGQVWLDFVRCVDAVYIWALRVRGPWRGRGIATQLLDAAERKSRVYGFDVAEVDVEPSNAAAFSLYEQRGYVPCGLDPSSHLVKLRKPLQLA
jgi:ribosomal protein S18 acetylase RimI-like enzyme